MPLLDLEADASLVEFELAAERRIRISATEDRPARFWELSAGHKALAALSLVIAAPLLVLTFKTLLPVEGVLEVAGFCLVLALELLVGVVLSRRLWRVIGPWPRAIARLAFRFWFVFPILAIGLVKVAGEGVARRILEERHAKLGVTEAEYEMGYRGPLSGENWSFEPGATKAEQAVTRAEGEARCAARGGRLPTREDLSTLQPTPLAEDRLGFWLAVPAQGASTFALHRRREKWSFALPADGATAPLKAAVLCMTK